MDPISPEDMEFIQEDDMVFDEPTPLPERVASNIAKTAETVASPVIGGGESALPVLAESALDVSRGVGQGLTFGASDELGGLLSAAIERPATYLTDLIQGVPSEFAGMPEDSSFADRYRKSQQDIQQEFTKSQERSPVLYTGGQILGGMTSGSIAGGLIQGGAKTAAPSILEIARNQGKRKALLELGIRGLKTYKDALPMIAAESALSSEKGGILTPEERAQLGEDIVGGSLFGLPTVFGLQAASDLAIPAARETAQSLGSKASEIIQDTPLLRQMKIAYGYGTQGINPKDQAQTLQATLGKTGLSELDNTRTTKLMEEINTARQRVGKGVNDSLVNATNIGQKVTIGPDVLSTLGQVQNLATRYPEIVDNPRAKVIFEKIASGSPDVTPLEAKDMIDYVDSFINKFQASTHKTPAEEGILANLMQARKQFSNTLKAAVPEYARAAERFNQFMKLVPETIVSGSRPVGIRDEFFSEALHQDQKLFDQLKRLNQGTTREGSATQPVRESFVNTIKGLKTFEEQEAQRLARGEISSPAFQRTADAIEQEIKANSDDAVARGAMDALQPHTGVATTLAKTLTGTGETGRAMSLSAANIAGRVTRKISSSTTQNPVSKVVKNVYTAPNETVLALSQKLKASPTLQKYGQALEDALNSPDSNRRNQVLFTIMQNPNARAFVNEETSNPQEEQNPGSYTPMP